MGSAAIGFGSDQVREALILLALSSRFTTRESSNESRLSKIGHRKSANPDSSIESRPSRVVVIAIKRHQHNLQIIILAFPITDMVIHRETGASIDASEAETVASLLEPLG